MEPDTRNWTAARGLMAAVLVTMAMPAAPYGQAPQQAGLPPLAVSQIEDGRRSEAMNQTLSLELLRAHLHPRTPAAAREGHEPERRAGSRRRRHVLRRPEERHAAAGAGPDPRTARSHGSRSTTTSCACAASRCRRASSTSTTWPRAAPEPAAPGCRGCTARAASACRAAMTGGVGAAGYGGGDRGGTGGGSAEARLRCQARTRATCSRSCRPASRHSSRAPARLNIDRKAGLLQVTDYPGNLDRIAVYVEAYETRALRQVRIVGEDPRGGAARGVLGRHRLDAHPQERRRRGGDHPAPGADAADPGRSRSGSTSRTSRGCSRPSQARAT